MFISILRAHKTLQAACLLSQQTDTYRELLQEERQSVIQSFPFF